MKSRQFHFVCFLLLLATLGVGEVAPLAARDLMDAGQLCQNFSPLASSLRRTGSGIAPQKRLLPVKAALQVVPVDHSKRVWEIKPATAQAIEVQTFTSLRRASVLPARA